MLAARNNVFAIGFLCVSLGLIVGAFFLSRYFDTQDRITHSEFSRIADAVTPGAYTDREGASVSLESYRGRPLLVYSWASWCPLCEKGLFQLSRIVGESAPATPVLAINRKETLATVNDYLAYIGDPVGLTYVIDRDDTFFTTAQGFSMPEFVIYDREGTLVFQAHGSMTDEEMRDAIKRFIIDAP